MILPTFAAEERLWKQGYKLIAGVDEVGRGAWAGPVTAAAVILPKVAPLKLLNHGLRDSKLLTPKKREKLEVVIKKVAVAFTIAEIEVEVINKLGISKASEQAMVEATKSLTPLPDFHLIDFYHLKDLEKEKQKAIKFGDKVCASIAAASILAKVHRDRLMVKLHEEHPRYGFDKHKGYGTKFHQEAIKRNGLCKLHRSSFIPSHLLD